MRRGIVSGLLDAITGGAEEPEVTPEPPPAPETDYLTIPKEAMVVALGECLRLTRKGVPIDMPKELVDEEGILWYARANFKTKEVELLEIHNPFDQKIKTTKTHYIHVDRFEGLPL